MKRLRNTGIYYTLFGILLMVSFIFTNLWRISILGIFLLLIYFVLKIGFKRKRIQTKSTKPQLILWDFFLVLFPFIYVALTCWYVWRPYKRTIIVPKDYEGIVAIQFDKPDGQDKKWTGGFLGLGASRLIEVDSTGTAKTQFRFHHNAIPFLGIEQTPYNRGGLKIYYEDDLENGISEASFFDWENKKDNVYVYKTGSRRGYPVLLFTIIPAGKYYEYYMTEEEMIEDYKNKYNRVPLDGEFFNVRILKKSYQHYYELQNHDHKK